MNFYTQLAYKFHNFFVFIVLLLVSVPAFSNKITELNRTIIFDLLMNSELSELRESNFLHDFCTKEVRSKSLYRALLITKTHQDEIDSTLIEYQNIYKKATIKKISFKSGDRYSNQKKHVFTFTYKGSLPTKIYRDGKLRFDLRYGARKKLMQIMCYNGSNDNTLIHLYYEKGKNEINIGYTMTNKKNGKTNYSRSKDFIKWNKNLKITSFRFGVRRMLNITYTKKSERSELTFWGLRDKVTTTFNYTEFNPKGDWTRREAGKTVWKRKYF